MSPWPYFPPAAISQPSARRGAVVEGDDNDDDAAEGDASRAGLRRRCDETAEGEDAASAVVCGVGAIGVDDGRGLNKLPATSK